MSEFILEGMMIKWKNSRELSALADLEKNSWQEEKILGSCVDQKNPAQPSLLNFFCTDIRMTALQFGNMQKLDGPTEYCEDPTPSSSDNCTYDFVSIFLIIHFSFTFICIVLQLQRDQLEKT